MNVDDYDACMANPAPCTLEERPEHVFLTPTRQAAGVYQQGFAPGWLDRAATTLIDSGAYVVDVHDPAVTVLRRSDIPRPEGSP